MLEKKVIIVCKDKNLHGGKINLPIAGEVELCEEGTIEVTEELGKLLIDKTNSWKLQKGQKFSKEIKAEEENDEENDEDIALIKENLNSLELEELVEMCEKAEYESSEYDKFKVNKKLMVAYIVKKVTEDN
jgi:hypothetical protein